MPKTSKNQTLTPIHVHELTNEDAIESLTLQANRLLEKDYPGYAESESPAAWMAAYKAPEGSTRRLLTVLVDPEQQVVAFTTSQIYPSPASSEQPSHQALIGYSCVDGDYVARTHQTLYESCQRQVGRAARNAYRGDKRDPYHNACEETAVDALTQSKKAAIQNIKDQGLPIGVIAQEHMPEHTRKVQAALAAGQTPLPIDHLMPQWTLGDVPPNTAGATLFAVEVGTNGKPLGVNLMELITDYIETDGCHAANPTADAAYQNMATQVQKLGAEYTIRGKPVSAASRRKTTMLKHGA